MSKQPSKIQEQYRDSDGYWIYLVPGFQDRYNPGSHTIVEDTKREALSKARDAIARIVRRSPATLSDKGNEHDNTSILPHSV